MAARNDKSLANVLPVIVLALLTVVLASASTLGADIKSTYTVGVLNNKGSQQQEQRKR